jgi:hypothetical protein
MTPRKGHNVMRIYLETAPQSLDHAVPLSAGISMALLIHAAGSVQHSMTHEGVTHRVAQPKA